MTQVVVRLACAMAAATLLSTACATHHATAGSEHPPATPSALRPSPSDSAPSGTSATTTATTIARSAFGMHVVGFGDLSYPSFGYGSVRIWDMGVTWDRLQPHRARWDAHALARLDRVVDELHARHVDPLLVLGMTPDWAARRCHHGARPRQTCGPVATGADSAWGRYVRTLVTRYDGKHRHPKITYFETWNEANLTYGWNDTLTELAALQATAYQIVHGHGAGQLLLSPSFATSFGFAPTPTSWIDTFLRSPGGRNFDIFSAHLYPTIQVAKAGNGPEWEIDQLAQIRSALAVYNMRVPVWDTETNLGSGLLKVRFGGLAGSALVARVLVLATQNHVVRTFWYAANEQNFGGVWLEDPTGAMTAAGRTYRWLSGFLTGSQPRGCALKPAARGRGDYSCSFHLSDGRDVLAVWTTASAHTFSAPRGTTGWYDVTGALHSTAPSTRVKITSEPRFVVGSFGL